MFKMVMLQATLGYCFIHICCVHLFSEEFVPLHWSPLKFSKLVSVLEALAASHFAKTASFFCSRLFIVRRKICYKYSICRFSIAKVKIEISVTMIVVTNYSVFSAGSVSFTDSVVFSLIFTAYSVVSPISTSALTAAHLSLFLSILAPAPLLGPWWPLSTGSLVLFLDIGDVWNP